MFDFDTQCCDANDYLVYGSYCAGAGPCINDLRPLGSIFWFSWPELLGLASTAVIYAALLLLVISIALSGVVLRRILQQHQLLSGWLLALFLVLSAAIHWFFLQPVLFVALSDAPAGLLALIGFWLLILAWPSQGWRLMLGLSVAGLLLGLSAWVRAFNLYPLYVCLALYAVAWLLNKQRRSAELLLFAALIPIAVQYAAIWKHYGNVGYIGQSSSGSWTQVHLSNEVVGYDTVIPNSGLRYFSDCPRHGGLLGALETRQLGPYLCLLSKRAQFYWGSDLRYSYITPKNPKNLLYFPETFDEPVHWLRPGLTVERNALRSPAGRNDAELMRMALNEFRVHLPKELFAGVNIPENGRYTLSVWLWSEQQKYMDLAIIAGETNYLEQRVLLAAEPVRYQFAVDLPAGYFIALLRAKGESAENLGSDVGDSFAVWGMQLEQGDVASEYSLATADESQRQYSVALLLANITMLLLALGFFLFKPHRTMPLFLLGLFAASSFAQALVIIPEQRFVIVPQIIMWLVGCCTLALALLRKRVK